MVSQPGRQSFDDRPTSLMTNSLSVFGWSSADFCLERVERSDTRQHFGRER
jgi:hypothetical protein